MTSHQYRALSLVIRNLQKLGYQRIGLAITTESNSRVDEQLTGAFLNKQRTIRPSLRVPALITRSKDWNQKNFSTWYKKYKPEVVIAHDKSVISWMNQLGLRVPEEVGFAQVQSTDKTGHIAGGFQNPKLLASTAVDFLIGMIQRNERGIPENPVTISIEPSWLNGKTLKGER